MLIPIITAITPINSLSITLSSSVLLKCWPIIPPVISPILIITRRAIESGGIFPFIIEEAMLVSCEKKMIYNECRPFPDPSLLRKHRKIAIFPAVLLLLRPLFTTEYVVIDKTVQDDKKLIVATEYISKESSIGFIITPPPIPQKTTPWIIPNLRRILCLAWSCRLHVSFI